MKIALTGGIACGKSTLAKFLRELGIRLLDADDVVHELEAPDGQAVKAILERFGESVRAEDGGIDRRALAGIVFSDPTARAALEAILFPLVRTRLLDFVTEQSSQFNSSPETLNLEPELRISVIPLLFESHWESDYDTIIAIASPVCQQIERMVVTRGYTRAEAEARLAAQMPVSEKAERSDFVVNNDSTPEHLKEEAMRVYAWLKERTKNEH